MKGRRLFTLWFILLFCFSISGPVFDNSTTQSEVSVGSTITEPQPEYVVSDGETEYVIIRVQDDEAVVSEAPDSNSDDTTDGGGLAVGMTPSGGKTRSWLKFNLSEVPDEVSFVSASLWAYMVVEFTPDDAPFAVHYTLNHSWSESTITWNNQPAFSMSSLDIINSPASPEMLVNGSWHEWDVTSGVTASFSADNYLSLVLKEDTEPGGFVSMKFFAEKEYSSLNASYLALEYIIPATGNTAIDDGTPSPVPEYIQDDTPTFSWVMIDSDSNDFQRGYEVQVWNDSEYNDTLLWSENTNSIVNVSSNGDVESTHPFGALPGLRVQMKIPSTLIPETGIVDKLIFNASTPGHIEIYDLEILMLKTTTVSPLSSNFTKNYGGIVPTVVLQRGLYETDVWNSTVVIDLDNVFMVSNDLGLIIEIRHRGSTGDNVKVFCITDGPASTAGNPGPGAFDLPTSAYNSLRTYNLKLQMATDEILGHSSGSANNNYPFNTDDGASGIFQMKYNQSIIGESGYIDRMYIRTGSENGTITFENFTIHIGETPFEGISLDFLENWGGTTPMLVLDESLYTIQNLGRMLVIDIANSFYYTNQEDLLIELRWDSKVSGGMTIRLSGVLTGGYRAYNLTYLTSVVDYNDTTAPHLSLDFVHTEEVTTYAGVPLFNATWYYPRIRTCDSMGIWSSWANMSFKYEKLESAPTYSGHTNNGPVELGTQATIDLTVTHPTGVNQVLIEIGNQNQTMTAVGNDYSYSWTPDATGLWLYHIYYESDSGYWDGFASTISVSDTTPPDWVVGPSDQIINHGERLAVQFSATDLSGVDGFWTNDTEHFTIDSTGNLTDNYELPVGNYGLDVFVNDTFNNTRNYQIRIRVLYVEPTTTTTTDTTTTTEPTTTTTPPPGGFDTTTIIIIIIAGAAVIIIIIIIYKKKGS